MTWQTWSSSAPTSSWKVNVSVCWKVARSFLPEGPAPTVPTHTWKRKRKCIYVRTYITILSPSVTIQDNVLIFRRAWRKHNDFNEGFKWQSKKYWHLFSFCFCLKNKTKKKKKHLCIHGGKGLTWDLLMTWLASSWMENFTPSSEEKEPMGDRVPEVNTMVFTQPLRSEKAWGTWKKHVLRRGWVFLTIFQGMCDTPIE